MTFQMANSHFMLIDGKKLGISGKTHIFFINDFIKLFYIVSFKRSYDKNRDWGQKLFQCQYKRTFYYHNPLAVKFVPGAYQQTNTERVPLVKDSFQVRHY